MGLLKNFLKSEADINELVRGHVNLVAETLEKFKEGMYLWLDEEDIERANDLAFETHKLEGEADDLRREIEMKLINGALLAKSRRPMLGAIERTDKLANAAEAALDFTLLQEIKLPEELKPLAKQIVDLSVEIGDRVEQGLDALFGDNGNVVTYTEEIEELEGEIDHLERKFIQKLFAQEELELAEKMLIREYLEALVEISDRAEDLSDEMEIITATRRC